MQTSDLLTQAWVLVWVLCRGAGAVVSVASLDGAPPAGGPHSTFVGAEGPLSFSGPPLGQMDDLSRVVARLASELERFNTLYVIKLERELTSTASRLSALESTVRAVADRALAWDNIQNHMAVWTDQSRTMERKLDILNRCHEKHAEWDGKLNAVDALNHKLSALDNKINAMTRLEFKVEQVSERVEEVDSKVTWLQKQGRAVSDAQAPGGAWGEFASRGVLTTLASIEESVRNLSRHLGPGGSPGSVAGSSHTARGRSRVPGGRSRTVRHPHDSNRVVCDLDERDGRLLEDVSAKVDLVFDRLTDTEDYDNLMAHFSRRSLPPTPARASTGRPTEHRLPTQPTEDRATEDRSAEDTEASDAASERIFALFWRSLFAPFKKLNRRFRALEGHMAQLSRQCTERGGATPSPPLPTLPARPPLTPSQLKLAVSEALGPLQQMVASNHLQAGDEFKAVIELLREIGQTADSSTFRCEEEASSTRELIVTKHRGISLAMVQLQKTVDQLQCAPKPNETAVELSPNEPASAKYASLWKNNIDPSLESVNGRADHARLHRQSSHLLKNFRTTSLEPETDATPVLDMDDPYLSELFQGQKNKGSALGVPALNRSDARLPGVHKGLLPAKPTELPASEPSTGLRVSKARRSLGCQSVSATGTITLPGAAPQADAARSGYFVRYCDQTLPGGGWTVIQRRGPPRGALGPFTPANFTRSWDEYKRGFGELDGEFWWGNENIHRLSQEQDLVLRFDLWDFEGNHAVAEYTAFRLANESSQYELSVSGYHGNASDSFSAHDKFRFSTYDRDNDRAPDCCPCAPAYGGGWWFFSCFESNLNGEYHQDPRANDYYRGLIWELWTGDYSLRATQMSVKPKPAAAGPDFLPTG